MTFGLISRGGEYFRIADPDWPEPLHPSYALAGGGRWNPPGSLPVLYLNAEMETARANVDRRFEGLPYSVLDLLPDRRPIVALANVPTQDFVDIVTDQGCEAAGLPKSYPRHANGREVSHRRCQPIGAEAHYQGVPGIACRSAARSNGEELAWLTDRAARPVQHWAFDDWYWTKAAPLISLDRRNPRYMSKRKRPSDEALAEGEQNTDSWRETVLSAEVFDRLLASPGDPPKPNPALERAAERWREHVIRGDEGLELFAVAA